MLVTVSMEDDADVGCCSMKEVIFKVRKLCTVGNLLESLQRNIVECRKCDLLQTKRRKANSEEYELQVIDEAFLCKDILKDGDVVVPGRLKKARSRSSSPKQEQAFVRRKQEVDFPSELVTFEGFPAASAFKCLNGARFARQEVVNEKPAFCWVFDDVEYLLAFYDNAENRGGTWRIGHAADLRQGFEDAIVYAEVGADCHHPTQVRGWDVLENQSQKFIFVPEVRCLHLDGSQARGASRSSASRHRVRHVDAPRARAESRSHASHDELDLVSRPRSSSAGSRLSRVGTDRRVRTPSCSRSVARGSINSDPNFIARNFRLAIADVQPGRRGADDQSMRPPAPRKRRNFNAAAVAINHFQEGGVITMDVPVMVPVRVDVEEMRRRVRERTYIHPGT